MTFTATIRHCTQLVVGFNGIMKFNMWLGCSTVQNGLMD